MRSSGVIFVFIAASLASAAWGFAPLFAPQWVYRSHHHQGSRRVSSLQMSGAGEDVKTGTVKWYNPRLGYGFITVDDGSGDDLYAHQSHIKMKGFRKLAQDEKVTFHVEVDEERGKPFASNIVRMGSSKVDVAEQEEALEAALAEVSEAEEEALAVAEEAEMVADEIDAAEHHETLMTLAKAAEVAEVEAARKAKEDAAAEAVEAAAEAIAKQLEEERASAEAKKVEEEKVAAVSTKKADDPLSQLKNFFGL